MRQAYSLAKLASLAQTMLFLPDLRRLHLTRSLAEPASLACTHYNKFEKITFFYGTKIYVKWDFFSKITFSIIC